MAGGMNRGERRALVERIHGSRIPTEAAPQLKHCWVTDRYGRLPGLLLEWRRVAGGWQGRVVRPVLESYGWVVVEDWLPADLLERIE
jgi:hypothetical protein